MTRVVVIGSSVAGKAATALLLRKQLLRQIDIKSLTVIDPCSKSCNSGKNVYTGLWTRSREILSKELIMKENHELQYVNTSGYRSVDGSWLLRPKIGMQPPPLSPNLSFIENNKLLSMLNDSISSSTYDIIKQGLDSKLTVEYETVMEDIKLHGSTVTISTRTKNDTTSTIEADIVIAADGANSKTRSILYPQTIDELLLEDRGYTVFRGSTSKHTIPDVTNNKHLFDNKSNHYIAFQTWGLDRRFAVVPTVDGFAWFCAVSNHLVPKEIHELCSHHHSNIDDKSPLWNDSYLVPDNLWESNILPLFDSWHEPIMSLLRNKTDCNNGVIGTRAKAFKHTITNELLSSPNNQVLLIGDARHTLDPILAQGAGVAIEDAYDAVNILTNTLQNHQNQQYDVIRKEICERFYQQRQRRTQTLQSLSNVSQGIGHLSSPTLILMRDLLLKTSPKWITSEVFDFFIHVASGHLEGTLKEQR